jgi:hypothetical protein
MPGEARQAATISVQPCVLHGAAGWQEVLSELLTPHTIRECPEQPFLREARQVAAMSVQLANNGGAGWQEVLLIELSSE